MQTTLMRQSPIVWLAVTSALILLLAGRGSSAPEPLKPRWTSEGVAKASPEVWGAAADAIRTEQRLLAKGLLLAARAKKLPLARKVQAADHLSRLDEPEALDWCFDNLQLKGPMPAQIRNPSDGERALRPVHGFLVRAGPRILPGVVRYLGRQRRADSELRELMYVLAAVVGKGAAERYVDDQYLIVGSGIAVLNENMSRLKKLR